MQNTQTTGTPEAISTSTSIVRASLLLDIQGKWSLPVWDAYKVVGVICKSQIHEALKQKNLTQMSVGHHMTSAFNRVSPKADLAEALKKLLRERKEALVIQEETQVLGAMSWPDITELLILSSQKIHLSVEDGLSILKSAPQNSAFRLH